MVLHASVTRGMSPTLFETFILTAGVSAAAGYFGLKRLSTRAEKRRAENRERYLLKKSVTTPSPLK